MCGHPSFTSAISADRPPFRVVCRSLQNPYFILPNPHHLPCADLARLAGFGVAVDADFAGGDHGFGGTAGGGEGEQFEEGVEFDEIAAQFEVVLGHGKSALAGRHKPEPPC